MTTTFRKLAGSIFRCIVDSNNRVQTVEGVGSFVQKVLASMSGPGREAVRPIFTEQFFKQMVDPAEYLPSHPVAPGDTWSNITDLSIGSVTTASLQLMCRFSRWDTFEQKHCAHLEFSGPLTTSSNTNATPFNSSVKLNRGMLSGKTWFDPELGMARATDLHLSFELDSATRNTQGAPETQRSNPSISVDETLVLKLLKVELAR